jgi:predicted RNA polymerase sigma factor
MFRRLGRRDEVATSYRDALPFAPNEQVRRFIERRLGATCAEAPSKKEPIEKRRAR